MARKHSADHRPLHPDRVLSDYPIAEVGHGPWPGRIAFGPAPVGERDPAAIAAWGADVILGLTEPAELARLDVPDLAARLAAVGLSWCNAPIPDFSAPDAAFEQDWPTRRSKLLDRLNAGQKVFVHCRAGRGRSGTIVAALLIAGGVNPDDAIRAVRQARPEAIETAGQESWVRGLAVPAR